MFEQDVQLAKLLLGKLNEISESQTELISKLKAAQAELIESQKVREERLGYEDVLARAAELLERPDLKRSSPEISDLQEQVESLQLKLNEVETGLSMYRELVDELRDRAPNLLDAAIAEQGESAGAVINEIQASWSTPDENTTTATAAETAGAEAEKDVAAAEDPTPETADNPAVETEDGTATEAETEPAGETTVTDEDAGTEPENRIDQLFCIKELKSKETYTFGKSAAFIIDATSVLERVPNYDLHFRALSEPEARDQLILDIDRLSCELSGDFHLIFNSWHQPQVDFGNKVDIRNVVGEDEGIKMAANDMIRDLAGELVARERVVCVVTGDSGLAAAAGGQGVHIIPLSEFFNS